MEQFLRIGVITSAHGVRGEAKVYPTTDDAHRFEEVKNVIIKTKDGDLKAEITNVRYFKNMAIVKFSCFDQPEEVVRCLQSDIMIERKDAQPLEEGEYYIADLLGCEVESDTGIKLGVLKDVLQTGANDVYLVSSPEGKELLFPVIPDCIRNVDIENKKILVHIMPGLMD